MHMRLCKKEGTRPPCFLVHIFLSSAALKYACSYICSHENMHSPVVRERLENTTFHKLKNTLKISHSVNSQSWKSPSPLATSSTNRRGESLSTCHEAAAEGVHLSISGVCGVFSRKARESVAACFAYISLSQKVHRPTEKFHFFAFAGKTNILIVILLFVLQVASLCFKTGIA